MFRPFAFVFYFYFFVTFFSLFWSWASFSVEANFYKGKFGSLVVKAEDCLMVSCIGLVFGVLDLGDDVGVKWRKVGWYTWRSNVRLG